MKPLEMKTCSVLVSLDEYWAVPRYLYDVIRGKRTPPLDKNNTWPTGPMAKKAYAGKV